VAIEKDDWIANFVIPSSEPVLQFIIVLVFVIDAPGIESDLVIDPFKFEFRHVSPPRAEISLAIQILYSSIVFRCLRLPKISVDGGERGVQVTRAFVFPFPVIVSDVFKVDLNKWLLPVSTAWAPSSGKLPDVTIIIISVSMLPSLILLRLAVSEGPMGGGELGSGLLDGVEGSLC